MGEVCFFFMAMVILNPDWRWMRRRADGDSQSSPTLTQENGRESITVIGYVVDPSKVVGPGVWIPFGQPIPEEFRKQNQTST